jgi:hypothetical protein
MLTDVLGVLIAFVSIILLLSIVVTGLVQATQAVFRVRARNLLTSVTRFLEATGRLSRSAGRMANRAVAAQVLNSGNVAVVDKVANPAGIFRREVLGPTVSWVHCRELAAAIEKVLPLAKVTARPEGAAAVAPAPAAAAAVPATKPANDLPPLAPREGELVRDIRRAEPAWCKRFQYFMRLVTIAWSVIIAVGFQVSAPALFASLSKDPKRVSAIVAQQDEVSRIAQQAMADDEYDLVSDQALDKLAEKYPTYADDIAQAGNAAPTKAALIQQLQDVLPDVPERPAILRTYSDLVDGQVTQTTSHSSDTTGAAVDQLAAFGISWWKEGSAFYVDSSGLRASVVIGVLITALLLTFGAPFWFEQLRTLVALRDPREAATEKRIPRKKQKEKDKT